jgi:hypothetical protein
MVGISRSAEEDSGQGGNAIVISSRELAYPQGHPQANNLPL